MNEVCCIEVLNINSPTTPPSMIALISTTNGSARRPHRLGARDDGEPGPLDRGLGYPGDAGADRAVRPRVWCGTAHDITPGEDG